MEDSIQMDFKEKPGDCTLDSYASVNGPVAKCCEYGNEHLGCSVMRH
jgi:hypothetical protein